MPLGSKQASAGLSTNKTLYVDAGFGNDATAQPNNPSKPYLTISSAQSAASSGDTVWVNPGTYGEAGLGKDGVTLHFTAGAINTASGNLFSDNGVAKTIRVTGDGRFTATSSNSVVRLTAASTIYFECDSALATGSGARTIWSFGPNQLLFVKCKSTLSANNQEQLIRQDGANSILHIEAKEMITTGGILQDSGTSTDVKIFITADRIVYNPAGNGYVGISSSVATTVIDADIYQNGIGIFGLTTIRQGGPGSLTINGDIYSIGNTDGIMNLYSSTSVIVNGNIYDDSATTNFISLGVASLIVNGNISNIGVTTIGANGKMVVNGDMLYTTTGTIFNNTGTFICKGEIIRCPLINSGGTTTLYGDVTDTQAVEVTAGVTTLKGKVTCMTGGANDCAIFHTGGKVVVESLVRNKNTAFTGIVIRTEASGVILTQSARLVSDDLGDSVYAPSAQTIKTYPGAVANTAKNVNITEAAGLGTLTVSTNVDTEA